MDIGLADYTFQREIEREREREREKGEERKDSDNEIYLPRLR